jgi:ATP-dependent Lon protease
VLAAKRAGIKRVVLPEKNKKDVEEIKRNALKGLRVSYAKRMEDVLGLVLDEQPVEDPKRFFSIPESEKARVPAAPNGTQVDTTTVVN